MNSKKIWHSLIIGLYAFLTLNLLLDVFLKLKSLRSDVFLILLDLLVMAILLSALFGKKKPD